MRLIRITISYLIIILISCAGEKKGDSEKNDLNNENLRQINILTQLEKPNSYMEALITGKLHLDINGCLMIEEHTIIWPHGYEIADNNSISNAKGNIIIRIGNHVQLSGGECANCTQEDIKKLIGPLSGSNCHGKYWIVGEEVNIQSAPN